MAKEKKTKNVSMPQKNVHLRLAFLHQAASYIAESAKTGSGPRQHDARQDESQVLALSSPQVPPNSRYLINQMKGVSRKAVVRLHKGTKRRICKRCDELLAEGHTSTTRIENRSKNSSKPWADVLVIKCDTCGTSKRFPVGASQLEEKALRRTIRGVQQQVHLGSRQPPEPVE